MRKDGAHHLNCPQRLGVGDDLRHVLLEVFGSYVMAGACHAASREQGFEFCGRYLREDTRLDVREALGLQSIQGAGGVPVKVLLEALHLQADPEGMGRKSEHQGCE